MTRKIMLIATLGLLGCEGSASMNLADVELPVHPGDPDAPFVGMPSGADDAPDACVGVKVAAGSGVFRRLSLEEQRNSFRDLLADQTLNPAFGAVTGPIITEAEVEKLNLAVADMVT